MELINNELIKVYVIDAGLQIAVKLHNENAYMNFIIEWETIKKILEDYYYRGG